MSPAGKRRKPKPLTVTRLPVRFTSDIRRVITRFFDPGGELRIRNVVDRVARLSDSQVASLLDLVFQRFRTRHSNIASVFEQHYSNAMSMIGATDKIDRNRRLLIGSYFTMEYAIESAALFNPSIVQHQNQRNLPEGAVRFIMSLRATGEGHVSSIVFRTGVIYGDRKVEMDPPSRFVNPIRLFTDTQYNKRLFRDKLQDIGVPPTAIEAVLQRSATRSR